MENNIPQQLKKCRFNRVLPKQKKAFEVGWQNNPYTYEQIKEFTGENYGVMCGEDVRVLDDDTTDGRLIKLFLEKFGETFRVRDHLYFKFENGHADKIILFNDGEHLGEIQGEGTYVVGPGSIHPSGDIYDVKNDLPIKTIFYEEFMEVFGRFINQTSKVNITQVELTEEDEKIITEIKDKWKDGDRQNLTMSLAGYLRKQKRLGADRTANIVQKICEEMGDKDIHERLEAVKQTYMKDENQVKGVTGLLERDITPPDFDKVAFEVKGLVIGRREDEASELISKEILTSNFIYTTRDDIKSEIWFYQEGIYVPNGKMKIKEISRRIYQEAYTPQRVNKVIAKVEADTMIEHDDFFKNESVEDIPVQNGILNIFTRTLQPFTPERIFFNKLPITYDTEATCPNIKQFFKDVLKNDDDAKVMFELIGFCLMKDYKFEKAVMFLGNGRNGKGKTLSLMKYFLGGENCCSVPLSQIHAASTSVCELYGRLANLAGDLSNLDLKDTGMFKQVTGRDLITAKRKYLRDLFFTNYAKIIFACNELPKVYDLSEGFWSRWLLFEFPYKFIRKQFYDELSEEGKKTAKIMDEEIIDKITTERELNGLLNEALNALDRIVKNGGFSSSQGTDEVKNMWIRKSDSFSAFCIDLVEENYNGKVTKKDLRKTYNYYCKRHELPGCSDKAIKATLEDRFGAVEHQPIGGDRIWEGIKLNAVLER